jgi:hypothetical protein
MYYIFVILMFPFLAHAGDMDKCNREHDPSQRSYCMAIATLSVGDCEKIKNMELRSTCVFRVRDGQRQANSYRPMKDRKEITEK